MNIYDDNFRKILRFAKSIAYEKNNSKVNINHFINSIYENEYDTFKILLKYNFDINDFKIYKKNERCVNPTFSMNFKNLIENSVNYYKNENSLPLTVSNFLIYLINNNRKIINYLEIKNINKNSLIESLSLENCNFIKQTCIELTKAEIATRFDKVYCREEEINSIITILARKNKNNPVLIGQAGVGKSAIVEELAKRIYEKKVPEFLINKSIFLLTMSALIANTKYRGEFEEKLNNIINEATSNKNIILFIDEIHTIVGAGGAEGAIDASNILKPALARGQIKLIGATTLKEYDKIIGKDEALNRRFQKVFVTETSIKQTYEILKNIKGCYEEYHSIKIPNSILDKIIEYSSRYVHNNKNPDKSIDILDELCASDKIKNKKQVTALTLKSIIEKKSNQKILEFNNNFCHLDKIKKDLNKAVLFQSKAINDIINILKRDVKSTLPTSITLLGLKGTGKSFTINQISSLLNFPIIKIDANDFNNETYLNKLLGSTQGYVGYEDKSLLSSINDKPNTIIHVDNANKMNDAFKNFFNNIINTGKVTDNKGEEIILNNCIIFFESNFNPKNNVGFQNNQKCEEITQNIAKNCVIFNNFTDMEIRKIIKYYFKKSIFDFNEKLANDVYKKSDYTNFGASKICQEISNVIKVYE